MASKIGATVVLDPENGFAGQVNYKSGVKRYFKPRFGFVGSCRAD